MNIRNLMGKEILFFDGAMGTLLQSKGLTPGDVPEFWNIEKPQIIENIHSEFLNAGCNILKTNTFGANSIKLSNKQYTIKEIISSAVDNARNAILKTKSIKAFVALDIGPTGKLLEPLGQLAFEDAYDAFSEMVKAGKKADAILIETFTDSYELKAAVLAAKENSDLPIFASVMLDKQGKLLTGANVEAVIALLEGLGVDAIGLNCGFGPNQMTPFVKELIEKSSTPVFVNPNAGLPVTINGETVFDLSPEEFAAAMEDIAILGPWLLGGCCGTTPEHLEKVIIRQKKRLPQEIIKKENTYVSSYTHAIDIKKRTTIIGEKINPTGNKALTAAIKSNEASFIIKCGVEQKDAGAEILDVNLGVPGIDEAAVLPSTIKKLQEVIDVPLMIDSSNINAIENAMRIYNGKPLVNSVNGKAESMAEVFPLVKKYGGVVVGLTLDENGIPKTVDGRLAIAKKIVETAASYGIDKKDIIIDSLTMTVSTNAHAAKITTDALELIKNTLGVSTVLGVSNSSFGLPQRENINVAFYTMAMTKGLSAAIMDPFSKAMMNACYAFRALALQDENSLDYIKHFQGTNNEATHKEAPQKNTLPYIIESGLKGDVKNTTLSLLDNKEPMEVINTYIIPALTAIGKKFEKGEIFLPQLLLSAETAGMAFDCVKTKMKTSDVTKKGKILLATVKGDIHDIGKNIVRVLLESYGYEIVDMGKDVDPQLIVETAIKENISLVGLSALMTTTVPSMEKTINLLRSKNHPCKIVVGGAVLTAEYADSIGADFYGKDAMATVRIAEKHFC